MGPGARETRGAVFVGSHLLSDSSTVQPQESGPEYPESVERSPAEFRVPLSGDHMVCRLLERGAEGRDSGVSEAREPPRSPGSRLPPASSFEILPYTPLQC